MIFMIKGKIKTKMIVIIHKIIITVIVTNIIVAMTIVAMTKSLTISNNC